MSPSSEPATRTRRTVQTRDSRARRLGGKLLIVALLALKAEAYVNLVVHPAALVALCAVGLVVGILKVRPVGVAVFAAPLIALLVDPASTLAGVALGFGAFALLIGLFMTISTLLHIKQDRDQASHLRA